MNALMGGTDGRGRKIGNSHKLARSAAQPALTGSVISLKFRMDDGG
jgi:hypothetical protein